MKPLIKYMFVLFISMTGVFAVSSATEAAQIGIGTEQKIVQNPLELERQAIEREAKQKEEREARLAEEKRRAAERAKREA
ncbi:murein transglycosylase, partial [Exiguobacterium himgiriensis]|nr:murein transglycosylase [Exiguobacterium himgiriensis]